MEVIRKEIKNRGRLSILADGGDSEAGFMTYYYSSPQVINVDHTVVAPEFEGGGIGKLLFTDLVALAREKNIKVIAECPFVSRMFERFGETRDVQTEEDYY